MMKLLSFALAVGRVSGAELGDILGLANHGNHTSAGFGGDKLERTFKVYQDLPMGEAALTQAGWTKGSICDPTIGYVWTQDGPTDTKAKPVVLYTTKGGQPSGVGVTIFYGAPPAEQMKYVTGAQGDTTSGWRLDVAFRKGSIICSGEQSPSKIGDTLIVNPRAQRYDRAGAFKEISLTQSEAESGGWHRGSCFDGMGTHSFFDTTTSDGTMSWIANHLFPVTAMYHEGQVNAIFFSSWQSQQSLFGANQWEPVPLPNAAMCLNTCDKDCTFKGTHLWSTLHVYFRDHTQVKCDSSLKCTLPGMSCCPRTDVVV